MMISFGAKRATVAGSASSDDAKMMGITPAEFTGPQGPTGFWLGFRV
jgi:hypothetical protein